MPWRFTRKESCQNGPDMAAESEQGLTAPELVACWTMHMGLQSPSVPRALTLMVDLSTLVWTFPTWLTIQQDGPFQHD